MKPEHQALTHFGHPAPDSTSSIYAFSPVYKMDLGKQKAIIKRTRSPLHQGQAIMQWLFQLKQANLTAVSPLSLEKENPVAFQNEHGEIEVWVAYPYIEGQPYTGTAAEITSAGQLLGALHALPIQVNLPDYNWPLASSEDLEEDRLAWQTLAAQENLDIPVPQWLEGYPLWLETLQNLDLPRVIGTWDYKANNLVYPHPEQPVLIDPDSAGELPRLLDLALAALLFHNEMTTAPARPFNAQEWQWFMRGYRQSIALTPKEKNIWPTALRYMFIEEALWLILNDDTGWKDPQQRQFLENLLNLDHYIEYFTV